MFRAESTLAPTSPHAVTNSPLLLQLSALNPLESALPKNQISHFANPIESTPFFPIAQFRANSAPVTPAYTTLTKPTPRNPIRMNTYTKHQVAPPLTTLATNSYHTLYRKTCTAWSYHFPHSTPSRTSPLPTA